MYRAAEPMNAIRLPSGDQAGPPASLSMRVGDVPSGVVLKSPLLWQRGCERRRATRPGRRRTRISADARNPSRRARRPAGPCRSSSRPGPASARSSRSSGHRAPSSDRSRIFVPRRRERPGAVPSHRAGSCRSCRRRKRQSGRSFPGAVANADPDESPSTRATAIQTLATRRST
jgi:hypothetical protein